MKFIADANLPKSKVSYVMLDARVPKDMVESLKKIGINALYTAPAENMTSSLRSHPDIVFHHLKDNKCICEPTLYSYFCGIFKNSGIDLCSGESVLNDQYPFDCAYNAARIKSRVFSNFHFCDKIILDFDNENYTGKININQGYGKCSICIVNENAIITSDEGIFRAAQKNKFDVLKINAGHIKLEGYSYGFIGGVCGLISNDTLAFFGDIKTHPDFENINSFLRSHKVYPENLGNGILEDFGSLLPIAYE